ncbi:hypothetical protein AAGS61_02325 [Lysinibacillus sp. KU-BSD001]|uniref:hypothetical protein n=1 Tax=Lysinibacillus sp. KU-BSD001 TaxID=3141328 RepID=UPI0036F01102
MKKTGYIILIFAIVVLLVQFFWNRATQDTTLGKDIHSLIEQGDKQIDLTALTNFEWVSVEVFGPYTTKEIIEDSMNIHFKGDNGGIDVLEDRFLLIFANKKHAVKTVVLSREYGDYNINNNKFLVVN